MRSLASLLPFGGRVRMSMIRVGTLVDHSSVEGILVSTALLSMRAFFDREALIMVLSFSSVWVVLLSEGYVEIEVISVCLFLYLSGIT